MRRRLPEIAVVLAGAAFLFTSVLFSNLADKADKQRTNADIERIVKRVLALENVPTAEEVERFRRLLRLCLRDRGCERQFKSVTTVERRTTTTTVPVPPAATPRQQTTPGPSRPRTIPQRRSPAPAPKPPVTIPVRPILPTPVLPPSLSFPIPQIPEIEPVGPVNPRPITGLINRVLDALRPPPK